jgi:hypothetical protein
MKKPVYVPLFLLTLIVCLVSGCEQSQKPANSQAPIKKYVKATTIEGTVSTGKSLIKTGTVEVTDEQGQRLQQVKIENGRFKVDISMGTPLPLVFITSETHPDKLETVILYEDATRIIIDPSTTAIAKAARAMGGYTRANLVRAAEDTTRTPDANKTTSGWRGDPTTQYGGWH